MLDERLRRVFLGVVLGLGGLTSDTYSEPKNLHPDSKNLKEGDFFDPSQAISQEEFLRDLKKVKEISNGKPVSPILRRFNTKIDEHLIVMDCYEQVQYHSTRRVELHQINPVPAKTIKTPELKNKHFKGETTSTSFVNNCN